jgi:hypothetical protein
MTSQASPRLNQSLFGNNISTISETSREKDRLYRFLKLKQNSFRIMEQSKKKMEDLMKRQEMKYKSIENRQTKHFKELRKRSV